MNRSIEDIAETLRGGATALPSKLGTTDPGVYVLWLDDESFVMLDLTPGLHNAAYAGVAEGGSGLKGRFSQEWRPPNSGRSSPRRTLGALLRSELDLHPRPRPGEANTRNADYYTFGPRGEARLTSWVERHGRFSYLELRNTNAGEVETDLINYLRPPLNIGKWDNPVAGYLRQLREECRIASREWQGGASPDPS